jgi:predicted nuclease with TOPRIM domain
MLTTKEKNTLIEDLSRKYQFHKVVKNILYKIDEENGLKVFKNIEELAQRESWMSDIVDCLEESFEEFEIDDPIELMYAFMDSWSETDYYYRKIYKPIKLEIKAHIEDLEKHCYRFYRQKTRWACPLDECRYLLMQLNIS